MLGVKAMHVTEGSAWQSGVGCLWEACSQALMCTELQAATSCLAAATSPCPG